MPISMPSTHRSSSCWTLHCGSGLSPSAAAWCWRHRMKPGATASAGACQGGGPASSAVISFSSAATSAATNSLATRSSPSFTTSRLESSGCQFDEAFLDVGGAVHLFGAPTEIAAAIRRRVRDEIGLPLSVGVARTKHLAKVASQVAKPDGLVTVAPDDERDFLDPLPIGLIWGVGPTTQRRLQEAGIHTIGQLAKTGSPVLGGLIGLSAGAKLAALSANVDDRVVAIPDRSKSMGAQAALGRRDATHELIRETLGYLADRVASRLRKANLAGRTVTVRVRFPHLRSVTRSVTLRVAISTTLTLTEVAEGLAHAAVLDNEREREITLIAVSVSNLCPDHSLQLELPLESPNLHGSMGLRPGSVVEASRWGVDRSIDAIRDKFGRAAVGYATAALSATERVPDEFRELAERGQGRSQV